MGRGDGLGVDVVTHSAQQAGLVAEAAEEAPEEGGDGRLTVRPRDADDLELLGRVAVPGCREEAEGFSCGGNLYIEDAWELLGWELLDDTDAGACLHRLGDEAIAIDVDAL